MIKKFLLAICIAIYFYSFFSSAVYAQNAVNVYFFWGEGCPHCSKEKPFLEKLEDKYPTVQVLSYEVWYVRENQDLLRKAGKALNAQVSGVPFTIIGSDYVTGFQDEATTGKEIESIVEKCLMETCEDPVAKLVTDKVDAEVKAEPVKSVKKTAPIKLSLPFFGAVNTGELSLPVLTILIGGLDGFNPCAMWTLVFLISLLIGMHDRKKMWILGSAFILASAAVYFLFMSAWLNLILFIGFIFWIRIIIGLIAVGGGAYNLREYFVNKDAVCKVTRSEERRKVFDSLKKLTHEKSFLIALGGIIVLAAAVNLIELVCSAGLPVVFTQILALNNLSAWQYTIYMLLYIFVFMLDDLIVFFVSMKTLEVAGVTTKYTRVSHLIGGALMLIIGAILILKPELLMFG